MTHRRFSWLAALLLASLALAGCRRKTAPSGGGAAAWIVARIQARDRTAPSERIAGLDAEALRAWIREPLRRSSEVRLEENVPASGGYRVMLELGVGDQRDDEGEAPGRVVVASIRGTTPDSDGVELRASTVKPLPRRAGGDDLGSVRRMVLGLVDDLLFQARLAVGAPQLVTEALGQGKDVARLAAAVEIAGVRRLRPAVSALISLLRHKDEQISDRAIGALVAVGDRAAVKPLTEVASFRDTARMAKVLDAIGSLGGQEAKDYLEFISTGHDDADIRNLASEALERMNRSSGDPKAR